MLHFGSEPRCILYASCPYCGCLLYQIWVTQHGHRHYTCIFCTFLFFQGYHMNHKTFMKTLAIITQIWHGAKWYLLCIINTLHLISVSNMIQIWLILLWDITTTQDVWNIGHIYSNLAWSQMLFYMHEHCMVQENCTIIIWIKSQHSSGV